MNGKQFFSVFATGVLIWIWGISFLGHLFGGPFTKWWIYPMLLTYSVIVVCAVSLAKPMICKFIK